MKKAIIIGNGERPKKSEINKLINFGFNFMVAADGGANSLMKLDLIPDLIIGDFDSISPEAEKYFIEKNVKFKKIKRQNDTDIEKAIKFLIEKKYEKAIILSATGDRFDHSFGNIGNLIKFKDQIKLKLVHQKTVVSILENINEIETSPNETISLYGIDKKTKITTSGLKYELNNENLQFGVRDGTSNVAKSRKVKINIKNGFVLLMRDYQTSLKYGFITRY